MDTGLDENKTELGVCQGNKKKSSIWQFARDIKRPQRTLVVPVALEVLSDGDSLLDQVVKIFRNGRGESVGLEDPENLVSSNALDLGNSVGIPEDNTDLRWGETLTGELEDVVGDLVGGQFQPTGSRSLVGQSRPGDTFVGVVHSSHFELELSKR